MGIFNFSLPIGWNEVATIATVLAVVVALWANLDAKKQLKSALAMQEQSKNVDLLNKRLELIKAIQLNREVSELDLRVLFNEQIAQGYKRWRDYCSEQWTAENDRDSYFRLTREPDGEGGFCNDAKSSVEPYEKLFEYPNFPAKFLDEYSNFCKQHNGNMTQTLRLKDFGTYNYDEIMIRWAKCASNAEKENAQLLQAMETFVKGSIEPIDSKKFRWKKNDKTQ